MQDFRQSRYVCDSRNIGANLVLLFTLLFFLSCSAGEPEKSSETKGSIDSAGKTVPSESPGTFSVQFKRGPQFKDIQEGSAEHLPGIGPTGRYFGFYHVVLTHTYSQGNDVRIQFDTKGDVQPDVGTYPVWTESQPEKGYVSVVLSGHINGSSFGYKAADGKLEILSSGKEIEGRFSFTAATGGEPMTAEGTFRATPQSK